MRKEIEPINKKLRLDPKNKNIYTAQTDTNLLMEMVNECIEKINELVEEVNELKDKGDLK